MNHVKTTPSTTCALLGSLMRGPRHGYEILQFINNSFMLNWRVSTSQLYVLLKRLEREGLVESTIEEQEARPSKRIFTLTVLGTQKFLDWLHAPLPRARDLRTEFLAKLFFFHHLALPGAERLIKSQVTTLTEFQHKVQRQHDTEHDPYPRLAYSFKLATVNAMLEWLANTAQPFARRIAIHG